MQLIISEFYRITGQKKIYYFLFFLNTIAVITGCVKVEDARLRLCAQWISCPTE